MHVHYSRSTDIPSWSVACISPSLCKQNIPSQHFLLILFIIIEYSAHRADCPCRHSARLPNSHARFETANVTSRRWSSDPARGRRSRPSEVSECFALVDVRQPRLEIGCDRVAVT